VYAALAVILATTLAATGCDDNATPVVAPTGQLSGQPSVQPAARDQLAGLAAAAKDKRYVATYTLSTAKRGDRTVTVAVATTGAGWWPYRRVRWWARGHRDLPCRRRHLPMRARPGQRHPGQPTRPRADHAGCVAAATLPTANDPMVQHIFTDWIDALVDRATALSVAAAPALPGARGNCFSVESPPPHWHPRSTRASIATTPTGY